MYMEVEMAKKKHQAPAKLKYDESHPIVSFRCPPDVKAALDDIKKKGDMNVADVVKVAVKKIKPRDRHGL